MANIFRTGFEHLNRVMKEEASELFTYRRGIESIEILVTIGAVKITPLTVLAGAMAERDPVQPSPKHVDHPFYFNAEDLDFDNGIPSTPQDGDTLEQTVDDVTTIYVLAAPLDGGRKWSYVNGHETGAAGRIMWNGRLKSVI